MTSVPPADVLSLGDVVTFRTLPIRRKLTLVMVMSSTLVLLLATASFVAYELVTFRESMVRKLATEAEQLGMNSAAALAFADRDAATKTLGALHAEPHVMAAAAYGKDGVPFATYVRDEIRSNAADAQSSALSRPVRSLGSVLEGSGFAAAVVIVTV